MDLWQQQFDLWFLEVGVSLMELYDVQPYDLAPYDYAGAFDRAQSPQRTAWLAHRAGEY